MIFIFTVENLQFSNSLVHFAEIVLGLYKHLPWNHKLFYLLPLHSPHMSATYIHTNLQMCATAAKSLESCPTLCDPRDGSPPGSPVPGILQARTLEWVAISFSNA